MEKLIEKMNQEVKEEVEYITQNTNSLYAEDCATSWDEVSGFDFENLDEKTKRVVAVASEVFDEKEINIVLADCSNLVFLIGIETQKNEIHSVEMWEHEFSFSWEIEREYQALSFDQKKELKEDVDFVFQENGYVLLDMSNCRWSLILDTEILEEKTKRRKL